MVYYIYIIFYTYIDPKHLYKQDFAEGANKFVFDFERAKKISPESTFWPVVSVQKAL